MSIGNPGQPAKSAILRFITRLAKLGFVGAVIFFGFGYWRLNTQWIEAGHVGVIYDGARGLLPDVYGPGSHFIGFRQQLYEYPTKPQNAVYSEDANEGEVRAADGILITTNDNANTTFDISVVYRVKKENVVTVFNTFGPIDIGQIQTLHIRRAVRDGVNNIGSQYNIFQLMGPKRAEASDKLTTELRERLEPKGISIDHAMILRPYLSNETAARVTNSINSFTQIGIAGLDLDIAKITSQAAIVKAEAEQRARTVTASGTQQKSLDMLNLELEQQAIEKWDGHLSPIQPQPGQTIIIGGTQQDAIRARR